ncbi:MAG: SRPBCC family protein [Pseudomonadota bacterium]
MKFSAREDVAAPIEAVFAALTDFARLERQALRRGIEVERLDQLTAPGVGMMWRIAFDLRGRRRVADTELTVYIADQQLGFAATVSGLDCTGSVDLTSLSKTKTRMVVALNLTPQTIRARMLLQGLKLAKSGLSDRFKARIKRLARDIEDTPYQHR